MAKLVETEREGHEYIRYQHMNVEIFNSMSTLTKLVETEREGHRHIRHWHMNPEIFSSKLNNDQVVGDRDRRPSAHQTQAHESRNLWFYVKH